MDDNKMNEMINIVLRQTDYTEELAKQKLIDFNNNPILVIRDYMKPKSSNDVNTKDETSLSKNQQTYKEIRGMMDNAASRYEFNKRVSQAQAYMKAQAQAQAQAKTKEVTNLNTIIEE